MDYNHDHVKILWELARDGWDNPTYKMVRGRYPDDQYYQHSVDEFWREKWFTMNPDLFCEDSSEPNSLPEVKKKRGRRKKNGLELELE
jgi:hypothetical protein